LFPTVLVMACLAASIALSNRLERVRPALPTGYSDSDLAMMGSHLKGFAFGMEGLLADWYWMRALQYLGDKVVNAGSKTINLDDLRDLNPRLLYPYLENATDLDPHFIAPYSYGALVLPTIEPEKAIAIARKGIMNNPGEWRLYQDLGYIYWKLGRYDDAADAYENGAGIPGAPPVMRLMSASMRDRGGSRETSREVFRQMLDGSNDWAVRTTAERRLIELDSLDERDAIDKVLVEFREKNGRCPGDLIEILPMLAQVRLPTGQDFRVDNKRNLVDPTGVPYVLDRENCRAILHEKTGVFVTDPATK
jgi:tetratricopeptide (TPR) repeat protein